MPCQVILTDDWYMNAVRVRVRVRVCVRVRVRVRVRVCVCWRRDRWRWRCSRWSEVWGVLQLSHLSPPHLLTSFGFELWLNVAR